MGRRYVRDKLGRFAPKGGSGKRGGKLSKSTAGRSAKAKYKAAASGLRKKTSGIGINTTKGSKAHKKQISAAKSKLTRTRNKLTGKGKAAGSGLKKGLSAQAASRRKQAFRSKATKGRVAKKEWKAARGADRKSGSTTDSAQKRVIKKQTGKKAYSQGFRETPAKTKAPRAGSKTKAQKLRAKIDKKKSYNKMERGSELKGVKKRPATKKKAAAKKAASAKKAQETAKQRYKKAKTAAKTAERFSEIDRGTKEARKGAAAKRKFTMMKKSMRKGATEGKGYGISEKGKAARKRFTQLKRERGGATKGRGTAAQKRAGMGYRQTQAAFGLKTKGRVPKGRLPGGESLKQQMKSAPKKVANYGERGKGSKAKRRAALITAKAGTGPRVKGTKRVTGSTAKNLVVRRQYKKDAREVRMLRKATTASNIPKGAKKNYLKRANEIEGKYNKKRR